MKFFYCLICLVGLLSPLCLFAQLDSVQQLPDVLLTDAKLENFSKAYKLVEIQDSILKRNNASLTEALRYNTSIYFKENGFGMVSSPSFRGTNAAQTAVIWNGININSVFTGQTDFNILSPSGYSEIAVRSGGGSVQYGSGAVGGTIHLNNAFSFEEMDSTAIGLHYGSFSALGAYFNTTHVRDNHYLNIGTEFISSENDYDYVGKNRENNHGQYLRFSARLNEARKLKKGFASWNSFYSFNDRNFSGSLNTVGKDSYKDISTRNLWQLQQKMRKFTTKASVAHLFEQYNYYPLSDKPFNNQGSANTFIGSLQSEIFSQKKLRLNGKVEYTFINAKGDNVGENTRKTLAVIVLLNHKLAENFNYGLNLRKEFLNGFNNPLLFSADAKWKPLNHYSLRLNGSRNFRVPTFNDLYWHAGGNVNLQPETSYQFELGQEISVKKLKIDITAYYISSKNLIKWIPGGGNIWAPVNISNARNYGAEVSVDYAIKFSQWQKIGFNGNYSYTKAENIEKEKQLIYVPYHKAVGTVNYDLNKFSAYIQTLFTGEVFTTTDNTSIVEASTIYNIGATYRFNSSPLITLGARLKNIFNIYYENVAYRPMPSRNFQLFLNFNI